ncbi:MAG TPA: alpha-L-rhamnosidase C-terminal domain-containing protein [Pelobium sp.]|nr:alpha-L-rhamnosidase C-terminal domain-containing protein [Pelobium sp.]
MKNILIVFLSIYLFCSNNSLAQTDTDNVENDQFQTTLVAPKKIIKVKDHHYFIDFGKDAFGKLILNLKSPQTDTLIIHVGEKIINPTTIDRKPGGTIRYQKLKLIDIPVQKEYAIKLPPDKRNTGPNAIALPDSFGVIMPFRYCEIENLNIPISNVAVKQKVYNYRFNDKASTFTSSDTVLTRVWGMCKHTIKATSFAGIYIDGDRERIPYEADAYINQLSHYSVDDEYSMARNTNEYFIQHPTWPTEWILHTVLLFYNDYLYTGNKTLISKYYDALKSRTLIDLERKDGLISVKSPLMTNKVLESINSKQNLQDIVDWPKTERDGYDMVDVNTVVNAFHYINLKLMAKIAGRLGNRADSIDFYRKSLRVKKTINKKLFNKNKGIYVDGENSTHSSLHANMFPLAFGLVPERKITKVIEFVKSRGMACSVYGAQYLLEALYQHGEADYAFSLMTAKSDRSWWNMIKIGSTMALEAWDIKDKPNLDWNHAWGTAPANIVTRYLWGITPSAPGFTSVKIEPQLSDLKFSKIKVPTIRGAITADYKVTDSRSKLYDIELPEGMVGKFILSRESSKILVGGKTIKPKNNSVPLLPGLNKIEIKE